MSIITDDDLLDYVIERDMEDVTSRIILGALNTTGPIGAMKLVHLLRGNKPYLFRGNEEWYPHFGRLQSLDRDQILDFTESLIRLGFVCSEPWGTRNRLLRLTGKGGAAIRHPDKPIPAMIPWPMPCKPFPDRKMQIFIKADRPLYG